MSREFISSEIDKIANSSEYEGSLKYAMCSAWILGNYKGINLKVLDMGKTNSIADYFVLGSASNTTQAKAMAEEITYQLKRFNKEFISKEGLNNSDWILLDSGDIIVHIFLEVSRDVYSLEELWSKATTIKIPMDYYFSSDEEELASKNGENKSSRDFF